MTHDVLMITHKRPGFTKMSLERLLESCDSHMRVFVWQNGNDLETIDVVRSFSSHPRFAKFHVNPENALLRVPTNWFWSQSNADYLSKVDDDCLVPDGWGSALRQAHASEPEFGIIATWLFYPEDFVPELATRKIREFGNGIQLMQHAFVQGSGYVMKRQVFKALGCIKRKESFTTYCIRAAYKGWINGWIYPFLHQDHMDDARSPNFPFRSEEDFKQNLSLSKRNFGIKSILDAQKLSKTLARRVQEEVIDPKNHFGFRRILRVLRKKAEKEGI
jgi:hypothetical protein